MSGAPSHLLSTPLNHIEVSGEQDIFQPTMWELRSSPFLAGDRCQRPFVQYAHLTKGLLVLNIDLTNSETKQHYNSRCWQHRSRLFFLFLFFLLFLTANYRFVMCLHCLCPHDQYSYIQASSHVHTEELYTTLFLKL